MIDYNFEAQKYCFDNDIKIYFVPVGKSSLKIAINYKGDLTQGEVLYTKKKAQEKIWELYEHFYKNRKQ